MFRTRDVPERSARAQLLDFDALDFLNLLEWLRSPRRNSREMWGLVAEGMLCSCFLPTCHVCSSPCRVAGSSAARAPPSRVAVAGPSGAQPGCCCFLPGCATCSPRPQQRGSRGGDEGYCLSGKGRTLTPEAVAVIASVDDRLREMLEGQAESKAYLQKRPCVRRIARRCLLASCLTA